MWASFGTSSWASSLALFLLTLLLFFLGVLVEEVDEEAFSPTHAGGAGVALDLGVVARVVPRGVGFCRSVPRRASWSLGAPTLQNSFLGPLAWQRR